MLGKLLLVSALSLAPLQADVIYHLTDGLATLQYTAPDFIASEITVPAADLDSCTDPYVSGATCTSVIFAPDVPALGHEAEIAWSINIPGLGETVGGFDYTPGTFSVLGHHIDSIGGGALDITEAASTPEPRNAWLLTIAFLLLYLIRARKRHAA